MMIPKGEGLRTDAKLISLATLEKALVGDDESTHDAARLMRDFIADVIRAGGTEEEAWVLLFAAMAQLARTMAETMEPEEPARVIAQLRQELLLETV